MPKYSRLHLEKAKEFIAAAEHDFNDDFLNEATSHAYYSMHHSARGLLLLLDKSPKTHSGVINVLWQNMEKLNLESMDIQNISKVFDKRVKSDYGIGFENPNKTEVEGIIKLAKQFIKKARDIVEKWEE